MKVSDLVAKLEACNQDAVVQVSVQDMDENEFELPIESVHIDDKGKVWIITENLES